MWQLVLSFWALGAATLLVTEVSAVWNCPNEDGGDCGWAIKTPYNLTYPAKGSNRTNEQCVWTVTAPEGHSIKAVFTKIDLEIFNSTAPGDQDYVEIFTNDGVTGKYYDRTRMDQLDPFPVAIVPGNSKVRFYSNDLSSWFRMFAIEFTAMEQVKSVMSKCGGTIWIDHVLQFSETEDCTWTVTAPKGKLVEGRFRKYARTDIYFDDLMLCENYPTKVWPLAGNFTGAYCSGYYVGTHVSPFDRLISSGRTMNFSLHKNWTHAELSAEFSAIDPEVDAEVQIFVNLFNYSWLDPHIEFRRFATITNGEKWLKLMPGAIGQFIHEPGTSLVNITARVQYSSSERVTFETSPKQTWIIKESGIFRQDGSSNLNNTLSNTPDHKWEW